ncbi:hypothetical protein OIU80_01490 [Flavobacterium sp. LS1R47]|uniref:Peptidase S74 domain-containing protein n=1 Tax=Flavobacterium frigoritolerans TaxID=2987686 RepID=A0A9X2ZK87_9FLAO|nr:hypothetical protein [Flavobacterium frigoritolerans]MCV9930945.1 hypothetical protein [Flavobacterium frigoritolerans]
MKKITLSAIIIISSIISVQAQTLNPTNSISVANSADSFIGGYTFSYSTAGTPWNGALISYGGFTNKYDCQISTDYGPNGGNHISFRTHNGDPSSNTTWNPWNEIWHSANLNNINSDFIAKTITSSKININGDITIGSGSVNANTTKLFVRNPAGKTWAISSGTNMVTESSFSIYNWSDNQTQPFFNIDPNGNIGIGTTNTIAKLTIRPTSESSNGAFKLLGFTYPSDQSYWSENQIAMMYNGEFKTLLSSIGNSYLNGGNVGIGTTNPDEKLTVNGKIHAKEVRIDLGIPAPDYVFANNYKLKSLQEVEEFIKQNSHLPEIPSAKEIEKNGLMLAEMNMSLLKKIEELTLYSIAQEKKINTQAQELEALKDLALRVAKIESELIHRN